MELTGPNRPIGSRTVVNLRSSAFGRRLARLEAGAPCMEIIPRSSLGQHATQTRTDHPGRCVRSTCLHPATEDNDLKIVVRVDWTTWWFWRGACTRSHPELGRENPQRPWYCVSRHGRVGRRQVIQSTLQPLLNAGWSSPVARQAHNLKVIGSNPIPATTFPRPGSHWGPMKRVMPGDAGTRRNITRTLSVAE
jgi:hypothetical protein